jgi:hypothetical protein
LIFKMNSASAGAEKLPVAAVVTGTVEVVVGGGAVVATGAVVVVVMGAAVVVVTGLVVVVEAGTVVVVVDEATVTVGKTSVVVVVALDDPSGTTIRAGLVGERVSSSVSSTVFESLNATSRGPRSTTTGGAIPTLATWIKRTHAAVAVASAIARRIKVPTPITVVPVGQSAWPGNPVMDCHSEWLYRPKPRIP